MPSTVPVRKFTGPQCPGCATPLEGADVRSGSLRCARCALTFEAAAFAPSDRREGAPRFVPGGATCALHELNAAADACSRCGAFTCELCRVATDGQVLCAPCFDRLAKEGVLTGIARRELDHASIAWSCFVLSFFVWFLSLLTATVGVVFALLGLRRALATPEREQLLSLALAALFNLLVLATWVLVVGLLLKPDA